ncbi:MAG: aminotransferase class V-fold PLP-dependent enzyme [Gemmatimonadaceae bacterium]
MLCQRASFSLPAELHYLNCAYMSPLPRVVEAAGADGLARKRIPSSITPQDFFSEADRARTLFARLVNVSSPHRVAIVPAASYAIASAARNLTPQRGQNVVVLHEQFPSNVYTWRRLCAEHDLELRTVQAPEDSLRRGEEWNAQLLEAIDSATLAVAVEPVHWTDGTRFDLDAIGARARSVGSAFIVDAIQAVGASPLDVGRLAPDLLVCGAYKWLLGPVGLGFAYYGARFDGGTPLEEGWLAREQSQDFQHLADYIDDYRPGAARYDMGGRANFVLLPMVVAAIEQLLRWTPASIAEYCAALTADAVPELRALGYGVEDDPWRAPHLFGIRMPRGVDAATLRERLAERQVVASLRGAALRISPNVYNDIDDIAALLDVMRGAASRRIHPGI